MKRTEAELQRAHDVLATLIGSVDLETATEVDIPLMFTITTALNVLCWALDDGDDSPFAQHLADFERVVSAYAGGEHACEGCACTETTPCKIEGGCGWARAFFLAGRWVCTRCEQSMMRHKPPRACTCGDAFVAATAAHQTSCPMVASAG